MRGSRFGRRGLLQSGVLSVAGATIPSCWYRTATPAPLPEAPRSTPWPQADAILAGTASPAIPSRTFPLAGARGDGDGDDTLALQRAIDGCHASGGGHVVIPRGVFLTGALRMRSRVDLNLSAGATLLFSEDSGRFPAVRTRYEGLECVNRSPMLYAWEETDLAVTGSGTLDASRTAAWNRGSDREGVLEPMVARGLAPGEQVPGPEQEIVEVGAASLFALVGVPAVAGKVQPNRLEPGRSTTRHPFLVHLLPGDPGREPVQHARPLPQRAHDPVAHR